MIINPLKERLQGIIDQAIGQSVASSISLSIGFGINEATQDFVIHKGHTRVHPLTPTGKHSIYDLASLTKILGTTLAVARMIDDGNLSLLETPISRWPQATVLELLAHTSGLPAHRRFYEELSLSCNDFQKNQSDIFDSLFTTPLGNKTNERVYSDLGFMALGLLLETRCKRPLFEIFTESWNRLGINEAFSWFPSAPQTFTTRDPFIAPTGYCTARKNWLVGQVHDPNCYFMGGLAGHAGLFGNLQSVARMGQFFLRAYAHPKNGLESIIRHFAKKGLGFDKPTAHGTTRYFSPHAFGHFGYAGTSLWIDPAWNNGQGLVVTLLTNRVHNSEKPEGIFWLRLAINQAISRIRTQ